MRLAKNGSLNAQFMRSFLAATLIAILQAYNSDALWPFRAKRFVTEALINAGSLGLESVTGRVVALGDWDGDQK